MNPTPAAVTGRRVTWMAYSYLAVVGFLGYVIGVLTPYLRDELHVSAAAAALHASVLALGVMAAGTTADAIERRLGRRGMGVISGGIAVIGGLAVMFGGTLIVTLAGTFAIGFGAGAMLASTNLVLGAPGGPRAEVRFARANAWALVASLLAPLLIAGLATSALGWQAALLVPLIAIVALEAAGGLPSAGRAASPTGASPTGASPTGASPLPSTFWVAWLFVVTVVSIEFAYIVWGSSMVAAATGVSREAATALVTVFVLGMLVGRIALGAGLVGTTRSRRWVNLTLVIAAIGGLVVWLATTPAASAFGLFVAGFGTASLYPLGMATALDRAGEAALAAGARLTLASGIAILAMPLLLGAVADRFGVVAGWPVVIGLCGVAFVLRRVATR